MHAHLVLIAETRPGGTAPLVTDTRSSALKVLDGIRGGTQNSASHEANGTSAQQLSQSIGTRRGTRTDAVRSNCTECQGDQEEELESVHWTS